LIEAFVDSVSVDGAIDEEWRAFIAAKREAELEAIIEDERLRADATRAFIEIAFRDGALRTTGTAITKVLPPASRFAPDGGHGEKKQRVIERLGVFFERFFGLGAGSST
ncbi:MAG TPA: DEAD/DEAH box helicase, partial [Microbacterium sp.]|nr:DEAD/DEAH box helicase [Microbacterium sp.]